MSNVLRPNRNALAWLLSPVTNSPTAGSGNGACQPPWVKLPLGSSSGPPGACITPSRVRNVCTVSFMSVQTERRTDSERVSAESHEEMQPVAHLVGVRGFEPPASTSRTWRANQAALHPVAGSHDI